VTALYANTPNVLPDYISACIRKLEENLDLDSAVTVAEFNMFNPLRARRLTSEGENVMFVVDRRELMTPLWLPDSARRRVDARARTQLTNPSNHRY
jgi:hypothetical protein